MLNEGPTPSLLLAKGLSGATVSFIFHGEQPTQLALYFIGKFVETSYTGVKVLLWDIRKN